jgi:hypothetical protein
VSQTTVANRPGITTFNGLNALNFDGTNDQLSNTSTGITSGTYNGSFNVFYVAARNSAAGGTILAERSAILVASAMFGKAGGINYISSDGLNVASNHTVSNATYDALSSAGGIVSHQHLAGARDNFWLNGQSQSVLAGTASNITGPAGLRIGAREGAAGFYWSGLIMDVIVTLNTLTTANRQSIEGYLAHKWGLTGNLPGAHPYKTVAP